MIALANGCSHPDSFARFAPTEQGDTLPTSTLAKARASVKNSRAECCASANGAFCGAKCFESTLALFGRTRMPVGVGEMSSAEPLGAPLTILLGTLVAGFIQPRNSLTKLLLGFCGCCVHRILRRRESGQGRAIQRAGSTTPTLFTPLQAIYTRPSAVATMWRTVPPPEGIAARANCSVLGLN